MNYEKTVRRIYRKHGKRALLEIIRAAGIPWHREWTVSVNGSFDECAEHLECYDCERKAHGFGSSKNNTFENAVLNWGRGTL